MSNISPVQQQQLLSTLKERFETNKKRHPDIEWSEVERALESHPSKVSTLAEMESTGGEPDVVGFDKNRGTFLFFDCSQESPKGRRSLCYDQSALDSRKVHKPIGSALSIATEMGAELLNEEEYKMLQQLGEFDLKTSSWIETPAAIRRLGGALYGDRRYNRVFTYHNGAESYYAARGFRVKVQV